MPSRCRSLLFGSLLLPVLAGCTGTHTGTSPVGAEPGAADGAGDAAPGHSADASGASGGLQAPSGAAGTPSSSGGQSGDGAAPGAAGAGAAGQGAAGQPGSSVDRPDAGPPSGDGCTPTSTPLPSIDAETPFGYRAADILAFAAGSHATTIHWLPVEGRVFSATYRPESGEHGLTVVVSYVGGEVRVMRREPDATTFEPGTGCGAAQWLEIDVQLEIASDAGALAEQRDATLLVHNALWATVVAPGPKRAIDCTLIAADEFGGAFEVVSAEPAGYALRDACLELYLSPAGVVGSMGGTLQQGEPLPAGEEPATGEVEFARIGTPGCERVGGAPIALDEDAFGITGRRVLELIASAPVAEGTWQDGTRTALTLALEHGDGPACTEVGAIGGWLQLQSRLRIASADGRIDATWPVDVLVEPNGDAAPSEVVVALPEGVAFDALGVAGVETSDYELVTAVAGFSLLSTSAGVELSGGLEIYGLAQVNCPLPPPGAPPCPEPELLESMAWTGP